MDKRTKYEKLMDLWADQRGTPEGELAYRLAQEIKTRERLGRREERRQERVREVIRGEEGGVNFCRGDLEYEFFKEGRVDFHFSYRTSYFTGIWVGLWGDRSERWSRVHFERLGVREYKLPRGEVYSLEELGERIPRMGVIDRVRESEKGLVIFGRAPLWVYEAIGYRHRGQYRWVGYNFEHLRSIIVAWGGVGDVSRVIKKEEWWRDQY